MAHRNLQSSSKRHWVNPRDFKCCFKVELVITAWFRNDQIILACLSYSELNDALSSFSTASSDPTQTGDEMSLTAPLYPC